MAAGGVGASSGGRLGADGASRSTKNVFRHRFFHRFVLVFPWFPSAFSIFFPCLEDIAHVTQVSESCNHFCEEGTTLLVHSHSTHKSFINHGVNRKLDKDGQNWTKSFLLVLGALQPQMCKVCCDFVRKSSLTSGHSAQACTAFTMFCFLPLTLERSNQTISANKQNHDTSA